MKRLSPLTMPEARKDAAIAAIKRNLKAKHPHYTDERINNLVQSIYKQRSN